MFTLEDSTTTRFAVALVACAVLTLGTSARTLAHEGHAHKVMGAVTMAAADHVMLKDKDGKRDRGWRRTDAGEVTPVGHLVEGATEVDVIEARVHGS